MIRLPTPKHSSGEAIDQCIDGITGNSDLKRRLRNGKDALVSQGDRYHSLAPIGQLHIIPPHVGKKDIDPANCGLLCSELKKVYSQYFWAGSKPARKIYDALLSAAEEHCPYCGGIGMPSNLDHYLPKAHFPQFSVLPLNLVPSCRDCNMGSKASAYATIAEDQVIHPYLDKDIFFSDQWIFAVYRSTTGGDSGYFDYCADPPKSWNRTDQQRAKKHFKEFDIALRFGKRASGRLGTILCQISGLKDIGLTPQQIRDIILVPFENCAPFVNHWQTGMAQALIKSLK